ncbi:sugar phosphate isomerase/epimerase family protein [Acetatifactor aquisgranensis]|uniref:sugar phosphate isomerase/epimerase family protein n=1 Tax=Acetatifactor aquisgranensis TaxID=2941233 RepID=UPI00203BC304|nr:sugar phosphate isomerase/epimerase family protein [Acetatifactor aquisgranensis]
MRLVTQTHITAETFGDEACIPILKKAGFEALDWSFFGMEQGKGIWCTDVWKEHALRLKEVAAQWDIGFSQAHAPFPSSRGEEVYDREIRERILRSVEAAALMGVRNIVVHPKQELEYAGNEEKLWEENLEFYRSLIPYCEEYGIRICAENMWQWDRKRGYIVDSVCARPDEFCRLLDELDSPWIAGCLDVGHCALVGREPQDVIRAMGSGRLQALHIHDVNYVRDCHTMPFMEDLDWEAITGALAEIGYEGDFTLEADEFLRRLPPELMPEAGCLMAKTGHYLIRRINEQGLR